jgi:Putative DNA-binding domain
MRAMLPLSERLGGFAAGVLDPALPTPRGIVGPDGEPSTKRFAVYRNNVVVGLTEALQQNFPAVCRLVGEEFFREMARAYVLSEPPASPVLLDYGAGFARFIASFEPAASLPYLADIARVERAWLESYHAPDAPPLPPDMVGNIPSDRVAEMRFTLHPSLRVVVSRFPAFTIWLMNVGDGVPGPVDLEAGGEDTLILRPRYEVEARSIPKGGPEFLFKLAAGGTLADAAGAALRAEPHFDLAGNIEGLIGAGAFVDCALPARMPGIERSARRIRSTGC